MWSSCCGAMRKPTNVLVGILAILILLSLPLVSAQPKSMRVATVSIEDPTYRDFTDRVDFQWLGGYDGYFRMSWSGGYVDLKPKFKYSNSNEYTVDVIKEMFPQLGFTSKITKGNRWKWGINVTGIPSEVVNNVQSIVFEVVDYSGIDTTQIRVDGNKVVYKEQYALDWKDVLGNGFTIESISKTRVEIGNIQANIVGGVLYIDPMIQPYPYEDGYLERDEFGVFNVYLTGTPMRVDSEVTGADTISRIYMKFNTSEVDPWDTLLNATLHIRVSGETCGSGGSSSELWLQNITDYGDLGASDWDIDHTNITVWYNTTTNSSGWHEATVDSAIVKGGMTYLRIQGTYELYGGVNCFVNVNTNESSYEPYVEIWYTDVSPSAPDFVIVSPANTSYPSEIISLEVSPEAGGIDTWWYSLDGGSSNVTFVPNTTVITSLGAQCIDVWLNNSYGGETHNQSCFTVSSYGSGLNCFADPLVNPVGSTMNWLCNYTYEVNGSAVEGASCQTKVNATHRYRRYTGGIDLEENLSGSHYHGFSISISRVIQYVGGGLYARCTDDTAGNLSVYFILSAYSPFDNLNGTQNVTSVNYSYYHGSFSCDYLDGLFGVKDSYGEISFDMNATWLDDAENELGVDYPYYGIFYGCPDCAGGNDSWQVGIDADNSGLSYYGNLSQTDDWALKDNEFLQWIYFEGGWINMTYNASSEFYEFHVGLSEWALAGERLVFANCSADDVEFQTTIYYYNVSGATLPICSIDTYDMVVPVSYNQSFSWSASSLTPFIDKWVKILLGNVTVFESCEAGNLSVLINQSGAYTIQCYVSNIMGSDTDSVVFSSAELDYDLEIYYSPYVAVDHQTTIYGFTFVNGSSVELFSKLTIEIDNMTGDMVWVENDLAYEIYWTPSEAGTYPFTVSASPDNVNGSITVAEPFCINVTLWNNVSMSAGSEYLNEFAWVYATRVYDPTLRRLFGRDRFTCPPHAETECMWHGDYIDGIAEVCLYEAGNYSLYIIGNNIRWEQDIGSGVVLECDFCEKVEVSKKFFYPLGNYYLNEPEELHLYISPMDRYVFGAFFGIGLSWIGVLISAIVGFIFFLLALKWSGSLKTAMAVLLLLPTIIYIILHLVLFVG